MISSAQPSGRTALVPGFMAGVSAAHERFGKIPFEKLFEPAIAFAREGVIVDEMQAKLFRDLEHVIRRFPETRAIYTKEDGELYQAGELFQQPELAATLESVASQGAEYIYTGSWGKKFVETLRNEGGLISLDDMANYEVIWSQPASTNYHGYDVYAPGRPGFGGVSAIEAFNLFDLAELRSMGHYSQEPDALFWLMQITRKNILDHLTPDQIHELFPGQDLLDEARLKRETSAWLWDQIRTGNFHFTNHPGENSHSAAVISVDRKGNVAALVHTSNAYFYGGTGISVDGVYVPDPAALQQQSISQAGPGERLPDPINPMIVLKDGVPVFASSCTGQIHRESLQRMVSMLDFGYDPDRAQSAPTIVAPDFSLGETVERVAEDEFSSILLEDVRRMGQPIEVLEMTFENIIATRGLWIGVKIDPVNGSLLGSAPVILDGYVAGD
jgi:gamma-glutamyltranspeptidase/glutathione hydrolase